MATTTVTAPLSTKVTDAEKHRFVEICDAIGTSPSNALRMFVSAFNRRGGFPFDPSSPNGFSRETLAAMDDAMNGRVSGPYKTNDAMWSAIFDDGE